MPRELNDDSLKLLKQAEGEVLYAYDDADKNRPPRKIMPGDPVRGTLTIGYGQTGYKVKKGMTITRAQAVAMLKEELQPYCDTVEQCVKVDLNDNQFGALVIFCYNIGRGAFAKSNLVRKLNQGKYEAVPGELLKWTKGRVNGKSVFIPGLQNRRNLEIGLWNKGAFVASNYVDVKPTAAKSAGGATMKAGVAALGTGGVVSKVSPEHLNAVSDKIGDWKDQLSAFTSIPSLQTILLGLTIVGIGCAAIALFLHHEDAKA